MSIEKYDFVFDPIAKNNLTNIFQYINDNLSNTKAANDLYDNFLKTIEQIREFPNSGEERDKDKKTRRILVKNYFVYYIPLHEKRTIYIIKITHATQKYQNENI